MSKIFELNAQVLHDGRVVLYQRPNLKKPAWQVRIKIPNEAGYVIRTTKCRDLIEARRVAEDLYDEVRLKSLQGVSLKSRTFQSLYRDFSSHYETKNPSANMRQAVSLFFANYALPQLGALKIDEVDRATVSEFFDWRRKNYKRKPPLDVSILREMNYLKLFLDWCYGRGHKSQPTVFERPAVKQSRRPHFDERDWNKLVRFLREWIKKGKTREGGNTYRDRAMLASYVLILANTGIRVGEARGLRWRDIVLIPKTTGDEHDIIFVVNGKTGSRDVVARTPKVKDYFERIRELRRLENGGCSPRPDEHVFCHPDGKPIISFKKGFLNLIRTAGVEFDQQGQRRTIYSLRHTYATFRLQQGVHHLTLASNMGTSTKMLEDYYAHMTNRANVDELTRHKKSAKKLVFLD
jgi:integrase